MFERYTEKARRVIFFARYEASQLGSPYIETEHLLLGLLREDKALANRFLGPHTVVESIRKQVEAHSTVREKVPTSVDLPLSHESKRVLAYGSEEAERFGHPHIGPEHLLLGLLREKSFGSEILEERGVTLPIARQEIGRIPVGHNVDLGFESRFVHDLAMAAALSSVEPPTTFDPVVNRIIDVLWRRSKNSPVLISEDAGSASAVVERLALRITKRDVPAFFHNKRILAVDLSTIVAGDAGRRALLRTLLRQLSTQSDDIAFFAGPLEGLFSPTGALSGHDIFLGFLLTASPLQCICAGTAAEYRQWIDSDPLLRPHFEAVEVPGPPENKPSAQSPG